MIKYIVRARKRKPKKKISKMKAYKRAFYGILDEILAADVASQVCINKVRNILSRHLGERTMQRVSVDSIVYKRTVDRLSSLLLTLMSLRAMGLTTYEKQIIEAEIARLWRVDHTHQPIKVLEREVRT